MTVPDAVADLVKRFAEHRQAYRSGQYNEAQLREEFLNPFFVALGWDVYNREGFSEAYKQVIHEAAIKVGGRTKAPDYCFRVGGGVPTFFVEAKKPSVDIRDAVGPAYQLRRYAWSAKLPVSILTDFEELAVYDCRVRPVKTDKASVARVMYLKCEEYPERWDELAGLFSPEAIRQGRLDKFITSKRIKKGTAEVDTAFLEEIESWRTLLARNIALRNPGLSQRDLNFAVGRTIDRIIFLRICEDRGIEPYAALQALGNGPHVYRRLGQLFQRADERYNSGLFHFSAEKGRPDPPDELTLGLAIDDNLLRGILRGLYYPDSPYEFSVFAAEILGQVYEQFLGKVIRLTKGHQAKIEDKPEVKKAGGVYYTPAYIVDYIVQHTVGRLLDGISDPTSEPRGLSPRPATPPLPPAKGRGEGAPRAPKPITPQQAAKLRILDPACGSGSFLLGAYQYLLDWHLRRYTGGDPARYARGRAPRLYRSPSGDWRLTTAEKKRILLNNIHGVDIDPQAVEVTKLSLLLKVLEGESHETLQNQLRLFHERALPDLSGNIKCGNSLIGPDFYEGRQMDLFDDEEVYRINAFDWKAEFAEIFKGKEPGFDAVIGNPPYISIQTLNAWAPLDVSYYNDRYEAAGKGNYDIYIVFVERGLSLLNPRGSLGFILPSKFFTTDYGQPIRNALSVRKAVDEIVDFRHQQVFPQATTYTCLLFLSAAPKQSIQYSIATPPDSLRDKYPSGYAIDAAGFSGTPWVFLRRQHSDLLDKARQGSTDLLNIPSKISRGSSTGADKVFMLRVTQNGFATREGEPVKMEEGILRTPVYATDFGRYRFRPRAEERVVFPYQVSGSKYRAMDEAELSSKFPKAYAYLVSRKTELLRRKQFKDWFTFSASRNLDVHESAHLMVPLLANTGSYCALPGNMSNYCPMASGGFTISISSRQSLVPSYVLGLVNSKLLYWILYNISNVFRGGWITCTKQYVGRLPIRPIDFSDPVDESRHDRMVELVDRMLSSHKQLASAGTSHQKTVLQRQIDATDRRIDRLVYELYDLTDEEIKIVEEATP